MDWIGFLEARLLKRLCQSFVFIRPRAAVSSVRPPDGRHGPWEPTALHDVRVTFVTHHHHRGGDESPISNAVPDGNFSKKSSDPPFFREITASQNEVPQTRVKARCLLSKRSRICRRCSLKICATRVWRGVRSESAPSRAGRPLVAQRLVATRLAEIPGPPPGAAAFGSAGRPPCATPPAIPRA